MSLFYLRQVNCLPQPERSLVEALRLVWWLEFPPPLPLAIWDSFWATLGSDADLREAVFRTCFDVHNVYIDEVGFVYTENPAWFRSYDAAVRDGSAPLVAPCPCDAF